MKLIKKKKKDKYKMPNQATGLLFKMQEDLKESGSIEKLAKSGLFGKGDENDRN